MVKKKVVAVQQVYRELERKINSFAKGSGIVCRSGCSACCLSKNIEATVLEFLPLAYRLLKEGNYDSVLSKLENPEVGICLLYQPLRSEGGCLMYEDRPLICRLFGFSVKLDKHGERALVSCRIIKEELESSHRATSLSRAPVVSDYHMKLYSVDPWLAAVRYPVNIAMGKALEYVYLHTQFRSPGKAC
ncbi:MAG: YkgJ family cysteine cluster protein [Bacteroidales bacterium]|nr:YkgJ family cysteine cluster protein [Bacteroidales bacterium]